MDAPKLQAQLSSAQVSESKFQFHPTTTAGQLEAERSGARRQVTTSAFMDAPKLQPQLSAQLSSSQRK